MRILVAYGYGNMIDNTMMALPRSTRKPMRRPAAARDPGGGGGGLPRHALDGLRPGDIDWSRSRGVGTYW